MSNIELHMKQTPFRALKVQKNRSDSLDTGQTIPNYSKLSTSNACDLGCLKFLPVFFGVCPGIQATVGGLGALLGGGPRGAVPLPGCYDL